MRPGGSEDHQLLDADGVREIAAVDGALGGVWTPHCAAIQLASCAGSQKRWRDGA